MSDQLFDLCSSLVRTLGIEHVRLVGTEADEYFYKLVTLDADWVINLDEDAFVTNPMRIYNLIQYMEDHDYVCAGMPDGGVCHHRFHNPLVQNAFFNIINISAIKKTFCPIEAKPLIHVKEYETQFPEQLMQHAYAFDNFEPYYPFFFWLLKHNFKMLYLDAIDWSRDETSTVLLDHTNKPFLIHCWYSRVFDEQPQRFVMTARFAEQVQEKLAESRRP